MPSCILYLPAPHSKVCIAQPWFLAGYVWMQSTVGGSWQLVPRHSGGASDAGYVGRNEQSAVVDSFMPMSSRGASDAGCLDKDCQCRNCKLGAIRCLDVACCHLPLGCGCLDRQGQCCPGGLLYRCQKISLQCGKCLTCGTLGCKCFLL